MFRLLLLFTLLTSFCCALKHRLPPLSRSLSPLTPPRLLVRSASSSAAVWLRRTSISTESVSRDLSLFSTSAEAEGEPTVVVNKEKDDDIDWDEALV